MKAFLKMISKLAALVALSAVTGLLLLILVYFLPTAPMEAHMAESVETFRREGTYPVTDIMGVDTRLDNYTDALMLLSAAYPGVESILEKALKVYRYTDAFDTDPTLTLIAHYGDGMPAETIAYERYWHGYLLTLKPALSVLNYGQIRLFNALMLSLCTLWLLLLMWKTLWKNRGGWSAVYPAFVDKSSCGGSSGHRTLPAILHNLLCKHSGFGPAAFETGLAETEKGQTAAVFCGCGLCGQLL